MKEKRGGEKEEEGGEKDLPGSCAHIYVLETRHKRCLQRYKARRGAIYIDREADCVIAIKAIL